MSRGALTHGLQYRLLAAVLMLAAVLAGGCSIVPANGPSQRDVRGGQRDPDSLPYALVKLTPEVTQVLAAHVPTLAGFFPSDEATAKREPIRFGIGDTVSVSIFEAAAGG